MTSKQLTIEYDGGDADSHTVDLRLLGESLQGIDRIIFDMIVVTSAQRLPRRGERAPLVVKAYEPKVGSVTIATVIQEVAELLHLGWQISGTDTKDIILNWLKACFLFHSGKKNEAELCIEKIAEISLAHAASLDAVDRHRHEESLGMQAIVRLAIERLGPATVQAVAPVGPSVRRLWFFSGEQKQLAADDETAVAIRERDAIEFGPLQTFILRTDGFTFHTKKLSVVHPEREGYLLAEVEDPVAEQENNAYARAVQTKSRIKVQAKAGYRNNAIERLVIMDFGEEIHEAA